MKKATKLLLSILPISSISVLSVVSCSIANPSDKKPGEKSENSEEQPKIPGGKTPEKNPKNPEEKPGHSDNSKPIEPKSPNDNKPNNSDANPVEPKKPDPDHMASDQPQNGENNNVDFSDVDKLPKEISFEHFELYKKKDPKSAWFDIKSNQNWIFEKIIFNKDITSKYKVEFLDGKIVFDEEKGVIDKVNIKFTKNDKSKTREFTFTGFKTKTNTNKVNNKETYLKPKEKVDSRISGLYPSILAYMLLYADDTNKYKNLQEDSTKYITFEQLFNSNSNLFDNNFIGLGVGTKDLLFDFEEKNRELYKYKIVEAGFDDINGVLSIKVRITNSEENRSDEPEITKNFKFEGFRKVDFDKPENNLFSLLLSPKDLKTIIKDKKIINHLEKLGIDLNKPQYHDDFGVQSTGNLWESLILKYLTLDFVDNKNRIYNSKETLAFKYNKDHSYKSILGLKPKMSLYPFNTTVDEKSIDNILITLKDKKVTLYFEVNIPVYASSLSDLTTSSFDKTQILKLRVISTTSI
ncbi:LppA family lipoprotein [Mycoplasma mycoides]|uniref:LppA family lipoprotein n=1 Tax=Mycoplasma mycoides TaxID=2102 RepID=UPI00223FF8CA|nr:LppA family lipoprotein [Mycoplasma mycoides]QVK06850.1 LppA family lipoprotein [Mycoplasma mycoides subsp. capri]